MLFEPIVPVRCVRGEFVSLVFAKPAAISSGGFRLDAYPFPLSE